MIMDCRTTPAVNFKTKLGFNQHDPIMTKEQSILSKIKTIFSAETILLQHNVLSSIIDAYFPKHNFAIEIDELRNEHRNIDKEVRREKSIKKSLIVNLLELIQLKKSLMFLLRLVKYKI